MRKVVQVANVWKYFFLEKQAARDGKPELKLNLDDASASICYPHARERLAKADGRLIAIAMGVVQVKASSSLKQVGQIQA